MESMPFEWLSWSNPVSVWWAFLVFVSIVNILLWIVVACKIGSKERFERRDSFPARTMVVLSAVYVCVCAFRSVLPRADVQRICLFNTWFSNIMVGRSAATVAEICFVLQWAIILYYLSVATQSSIVRKIACCIAPLIICAECWSWYAVLTTNYLGNAIENSIWAVTFLLVAAGLFVVQKKFDNALKGMTRLAILGALCFAAFEFIVDVPMYIDQWHTSVASGTQLLSFSMGLRDISSHWVVSHDVAQWRGSMLWMSLYFSVAVWASVALCCFTFIKDDLHAFLKEGVQE
jgi:hypothetical protein